MYLKKKRSRQPWSYSPSGRNRVLSLPSIWDAGSPGVSSEMSGVEPSPVPLLACRTHYVIWMDPEEEAKCGARYLSVVWDTL